MTTLRQIGERKIIRALARVLPAPDSRVAAGIGDDCAVLRTRRGRPHLLLTSDAVIAGVHFDRDASPRDIGRKAAGRVLSDIAAMGGAPRWALVDLVAPPSTPMSRILGIYGGLSAMSRRFGMSIVGGDTAAGPTLELHVFAMGEVPAGAAVLRSGAHPGDILYVTGALGGSRAGRHLRFEPRVNEGIWLRKRRYATAMIDVSDGLATDLRHLIDMSGVGACLDVTCIPVSRAARRCPDGRTPIEHALFDGEDFELLFTVPPRLAHRLESEWDRFFRVPCTAIGFITPTKGRIECRHGNSVRILETGAYEHFR